MEINDLRKRKAESRNLKAERLILIISAIGSH
jgi:hypothetical protein